MFPRIIEKMPFFPTSARALYIEQGDRDPVVWYPMRGGSGASAWHIITGCHDLLRTYASGTVAHKRSRSEV